MCSLTGLAPRALDMIFGHVRPATAPRGRPWALPLEQRVIIRPKPIASSPISSRESRRSYAQRSPPSVVDGTLVPTRDHSAAAKAKNYRWSCNAQVLVRRRDLRVIAVAAGGPGNRNDPIHYRGSAVQHLCRVHGRVLADGGYTVACPSSSFRPSVGGEWFGTGAGAVIDDDAHASNTPSLGSRTGVSCAITDGAAHTCFNHCKRSLCCTTSGSNYETTLSSLSPTQGPRRCSQRRRPRE